MDFLALDVETANSDYSSICQIGIATFSDGEVIDTWSSLINPEDYFDLFNIQLHGIDENKVKGSPTFDQVYKELIQMIQGKIVVHHMPFDRVAVTRACEKYETQPLAPIWLDTSQMARRTWEEVAYVGYNLVNLTKMLDIKFQHHDALEDAQAAGMIAHKVCELSEMNIDDWIERAKKPINLYEYKGKEYSTIHLEGNPEGPLFGENLVFTGTLFLTRNEAGELASELGCSVTNSVTKKTTMLVVGKQDAFKLAGHEKSSKHRKAEGLIANGQHIRILSEDDFEKIFELQTL